MNLLIEIAEPVVFADDISHYNICHFLSDKFLNNPLCRGEFNGLCWLTAEYVDQLTTLGWRVSSLRALGMRGYG